MALITVADVTITYDGLVAAENVSFNIGKGDYLVIVGENGSGKSSIMKAMLGLVRPRSGKITYGDGLARTSIGYLPQQTQAQRDFPASVEEVVRSGSVSRLGRRFFFSKEDRARADRAMEMLDIASMRRKPYRDLSGGQQQRALLARALCATDSLLLLDEPVTGLDPAATDELYAIVRRLNEEQGVAIAMVSHDLRDALRDARTVLVMDRGVSFFGSADEYAQTHDARGRKIDA